MSFLDEILGATRARVALLQEEGVPPAADPPPALRSFRDAILGAERPALIAEIKRATPSHGVLDGNLDAAAQAHAYALGGAAAISVLTEPQWFLGSPADVDAARGAGLPVLRKDFLLDPLQVAESRAFGADAVLVIVRIVDDPTLKALLEAVKGGGMEALVEVFDERDLDRALGAGADIVGVNQRDLETFEVDRERTAKLAPLLPDDVTLISLSGVESRAEVEALAAAGAKGVLVGSSLVTSLDPVAKLAELRGA